MEPTNYCILVGNAACNCRTTLVRQLQRSYIGTYACIWSEEALCSITVSRDVFPYACNWRLIIAEYSTMSMQPQARPPRPPAHLAAKAKDNREARCNMGHMPVHLLWV